MRKKNALWVCLVTLLLFTTAIVHVGASRTKVYVDPPVSYEPDIGDEFTVKITVADVNDLTGFEFKLFWDRALLNVTAASRGSIALNKSWENRFWLPYSPDVPLNNTYDATHGRFWLGCLNLTPIPISGNFILATLTFRVMGLGNCTLALRDTKLTDSKAAFIPHDTIDGEFTTSGKPPTPSMPLPVEKIAIGIIIAVFLVVALYFARKKILK